MFCFVFFLFLLWLTLFVYSATPLFVDWLRGDSSVPFALGFANKWEKSLTFVYLRVPKL